MKQDYIRQVKKALIVSGKKKSEIVRDLQEAFASALEHGETEQQVIERLGSPNHFADSIHEQLGINYLEKKKRKKRMDVAIALMVMVISFLTGILIRIFKGSKDVIGQGDALTSIQISGTAIDMSIPFLLLGCVSLIVAVILIVRYIRHPKN